MAVLSREHVAQIAYQAGWRGDALNTIVAIAERESGYRPDAHRTDQDPSAMSGDRGLWQINYIHDDVLRQAGIISSPQDLFDPVVNAQAALFLYQRSGSFYPWGAGPGGWTAGGDPLYGTNPEAARRAVQNAQQQGLLGQPYQGGGTVRGSSGASTGQTTRSSGPMRLPGDAKVHVVVNGSGTPMKVWAVFDLGNGVKLGYDLDKNGVDWRSHPTTTVQVGDLERMGVINAGRGEELAPLAGTFDTYREFWDSLLLQVMGPHNPARNDSEVLRVLAEYAARPDMSEAELQNRLRSTRWFQNRTQSQLEWNSLSDAERDVRREEAESRVIDTWFQYAGVDLNPDDPRIANYVEQLASGAMGWGAFSQIVKDQALDNSESPWARDVRSEREAQLQRGIDIENTMSNIRDTLQRWGLSWTNSEIQRWAKQIVSNEKSDDDLIQAVQRQASGLYPGKDPEMETLQWAQPWLQTYERTLESVGALEEPLVQKALTRNQPVWEFEQDLKRSDRWLGTKNARTQLVGAMSDVGRLMGYE